MGTPHKELFLAEHGPSLGVPLVMGVGGAIDVVGRRHPPGARDLWQRMGLEWLYRMLAGAAADVPPLCGDQRALRRAAGRALVGQATARRHA